MPDRSDGDRVLEKEEVRQNGRGFLISPVNVWIVEFKPWIAKDGGSVRDGHNTQTDLF